MKVEEVRNQLILLIPESYTVLKERDWLWLVPPETMNREEFLEVIALGFQTSHKGREYEGIGRAALYHKCRFLPDEYKKVVENTPYPHRGVEEEEEVDLLAGI